VYIGRYEVLEEVGRGGAAIVFRARDPSSGRIVALKLLKRVGKDALVRWDRERRLLDSFTEKDGIVPLLDANADPPFVVLPFLEGGTLRDRLARGPLRIDETVTMVERLARSLGRAHEKGIVHRDVKPENILFDERWNALLADFGIAKHFNDTTPGASQSVDLSRTGEMRGTAGYMAPEQVLGKREVGPQADVWALGAVLYECLAGAPAFTGDSLLEVVERTSRGRTEPLSRHRRDVPPWLAHVVGRALEPRLDARYADGHALAAALRAGPAGMPPPSRSRPVLVVALLLLLAGVAIAGAFHRQGARREAFAASLAAADAAALRSDARAVVACLSSAVALEPSDVTLRLRRGEARLELKDGAGARADFEQAVALAPSVRAYLGRARTAALLGDTAAALDAASRAIALDPRSAEAFAARGHLRPVADHEARRSDFDRAVTLEPRNASYRLLRGGELLALGDSAAALEDAEQGCLLDPSNADGWTLRGDMAVVAHDRTRARNLFEHAIELDANNRDAHANLAVILFAAGDNDGALAHVTRAIALGDPAPADEHVLHSKILESKGDHEAAAASADRAVARDPKLASGWQARSNARISLGTHAIEAGALPEESERILRPALADVDRAIELSPDDSGKYVGRAYLRRMLGDPHGSIDDATRALELAPNEGRAFSNRAAAHLMLGETDAAFSDAQETIRILPRFGFGYAFRGLALLAKGEKEAARSDLLRALELEFYGPDKLAVERALRGL
jgi:tetratricopeptide (TPR) repeat protein